MPERGRLLAVNALAKEKGGDSEQYKHSPDLEKGGNRTDELIGGKEPQKEKESRPPLAKSESRRSLPSKLAWVPENWTWAKIKPVIRCAVALWASAVVFVIPEVERALGQASFLILVAAVFLVPNDPFVTVLERELLVLLFAVATWAWCCLGIKFADMARRGHNHTVNIFAVASGQYIEAWPSVIHALFLGVWTAVLCYIKARQGPAGPWTFATVFACIGLDIILTTSALFPLPYYAIGQAIILPLCVHSVIALLVSILVFPCSVSAQFRRNLQQIIDPLVNSLSLHQHLLQSSSPTNPEFAETSVKITSAIGMAEARLLPLAASARMLGNDLVYARYAPGDYRVFQVLARRLANRGNGMVTYFSLIDPTRERFPITPAAVSPATSPKESRAASPERSSTLSRSPSATAKGRLESRSSSVARTRSGRRHHTSEDGGWHGISGYHHQHHHHARHHSHDYHHLGHAHAQHKTLHQALLAVRASAENVVGVFEMQKYLNLEATRMRDPFVEEHTEQAAALLNDSCQDLLEGCRKGLLLFQNWLENLRHGRVRYLLNPSKVKSQWAEQLLEHERVRDELASTLEHFRNVQRHRVIEPYRPAFEQQEDSPVEQDVQIPAHRYLFHCFVYQYHLIQFSGIVMEVLDEIIRLQKERQKLHLWTPVRRLIKWNNWEIAEEVEHVNDEDPDCLPGINPAVLDDLGIPRRRDPDALPPRNATERVMGLVYYALSSLTRGNVMFAIKAAFMTVLLALPAFLKSSAGMAYKHRYVWAVAMGQISLSRFRGDTVHSFFSRVFSTMVGCVIGLIMWYVSSGSSPKGNPYGLAAVFLVCCFPFMYARLYWPLHPVTNIILWVTSMLVVGYSYQGATIVTPGSPGHGFEVAWRRFVLVVMGVFAAFIVSYLPPSTTIRHYQRASLATTCSELGSIYCAILSVSNTRNMKEVEEINSSLLAVRSKLRRLRAFRTNVVYEFSLRGRWPMERYNQLTEIQLQMACHLSHFMSVVKHLEPAWARALLRRTRFLDTDFQGDTLAVITLISSSIRSGCPLPQITPCPLLDRFMLHYHGLDVIHKHADEDYGLPRTLTLETLRDEQYLFFCVGVATAYSITTRLDRLMVAAKEIVGEQYHIHGVGLGPTFSMNTEVEGRKPHTQSTPQEA